MLNLDTTKARWRTDPGGEEGGLFELMGRVWGVSALQAGLRLAAEGGEPGIRDEWGQRPPSGGTASPDDLVLVWEDPALQERGLDPASSRDRQIGRVAEAGHPYDGWLAVTIFDLGGRRVGRAYRRPRRKPIGRPGWSRGEPRWSVPPGFPIGRHLYNLDRAWPSLFGSDAAILVEGPFDALRLHGLGWTNTVALLGNRLTGWHVDLLLTVGVGVVVLLLDNDHGGHLGRRWALDTDGRLDQFRVVDLHRALPPGRDPDDVTAPWLGEWLGPYRPP
jgi:hypothetical protein